MAESDRKRIAEKYQELINSVPHTFPREGKVHVSKLKGVYIIYAPSGDVLHVGRNTKAKGGIDQRLNNHINGRSSFMKKVYNRDGSMLRGTHKFRFLALDESYRDRAWLEALTAGLLCPEHIG
mgnify:CR=1 FL=1